MSIIPYKAPTHGDTSFNCPICQAFAQQTWHNLGGVVHYGNSGLQVKSYLHDYTTATCSHCEKASIWVFMKMVYPQTTIAPLPNPDMPDNVKGDYEEARLILMNSPRGAAALLRLAIQKLCIHLGEKGDKIDTDIANLVKKGLPIKLQKALDTVRVVGNNAVHPGVIDLTDDVDLAGKLFVLTNIICDSMITQNKQIDDLYGSTIPENIKDAIDKRDGKK